MQHLLLSLQGMHKLCYLNGVLCSALQAGLCISQLQLMHHRMLLMCPEGMLCRPSLDLVGVPSSTVRLYIMGS